MTNRRVLVVIDSLANGGAQKQASLLASCLQESGITVFLAYYQSQQAGWVEYLRERGVSLCFCGYKKARFRFSFVKFLREIIRAEKIDFVISFLDAPSVYSALAVVPASRAKLIVCKRNFSKFKKATFLVKILDLLAMAVADKIVTNSYAEADYLRSRRIFDPCKITTIWNGFEKPADVRNFSKDKSFRLLVVARVAEQKNVLATIGALSRVNSSEESRITIDWAGNFDCDDDYRRQISQHLANARLLDNWHWLGQLDNVSDYFSGYDALLLPSLFEGLPNALCEAMSCGLPVISTNVCDNPRLLADGKNGVLAHGVGPDELATAIRRFYALSRAETEELVANAKSFVDTQLSVARLASRFLRLLDDVSTGTR